MKVAKDQRPLSPHLQVYKWETHMAMSILHRATGVASAVGLLMLTCWLLAAGGGEASWRSANQLFRNPLIVLIMFFWSGALIYHLCNGIRHLTWDVGKGLGKDDARKSAKVVQIVAAVLTLSLWIGIWAQG